MWTGVSLVIFFGALFVAVQWYTGVRKLPVLSREKTAKIEQPPSVSIIVAARNEETTIYRAVSKMLDQLYPEIEVIVVDDRSTDRTSTYLHELKAKHHQRRKLKIIEIDTLPPGWLGKNHALYRGTQHAAGEWYVFMDADVMMEKNTLWRSVHYCLRHNLDHFALVPENIGGTLPYRAFHSYWGILGIWNFIQLKHAGIGAFNMVKANVYEQIGTHGALKMSPDDDLKLGKRIVEKGYRQQLGFGTGLLRIQWYDSLKATAQGLEKNLFAFMRYRLSYVLVFSVLIFCTHVLPFIGIWLREPAASFLFAATLILYFTMYAYNRQITGESLLYFFWMPLNGLFFITCLLRSAYKALKTRQVDWRGTSYSLTELRKRL
ncbi:glycosyltransferase [Salisediminibacterium halotolerans]|uniref:4,4'-diaponeurosporenoate glycosyltransferase n=1 Tax=Salisediminibacterium halotolerans TaxID=517425 RepID=A0A1H9UHF6_9BACI|nr:glycosyltransferase [Salisediminibacterium haloalkalitolerans]SES08779.1 Glycosyltransferase, catalytic subunit of cellulose synthase and poly-beta-1,6-N-acetylglucosamine synthase [Salisediminibacterium haloalkalitolerans]